MCSLTRAFTACMGLVEGSGQNLYFLSCWIRKHGRVWVAFAHISINNQIYVHVFYLLTSGYKER